MRLTFLGGAEEIGASCVWLEIGGKHLLIDCGLRPRGGADALPLLGLLDGVVPDAIVLTHAHLDHVGAMPLLLRMFPDVPVYMTAATLSLCRIMLLDSLKLGALRWELGGQPPLFGVGAVEVFLDAVRCVPLNAPSPLCDGQLQMRFFPAGHILGAVSVFLESDEGSALITGDLSIDDQLTIPGAMLPPLRPDVMVIESTYGGRLHNSRAAEHRRLVSQARGVLAGGGSLLYPAFAVGRAQEIILLLSRAVEAGELPEVPIFVDGLVKKVCGVFQAHAALTSPWLRARIEAHGDPFFFEGGPARPVRNVHEREQALHTSQALYVASSGALSGGPSVAIARHLATDPRHFIALTGYQDADSPGRALQEMARRQRRGQLWRLGAERVRLQCGVGTYALSAHADGAQLLSVVEAMQPRHVAFVHGGQRARHALADAVVRSGLCSAHLPEAGDRLVVPPTPGAALRRRASRHAMASPAAQGARRALSGDEAPSSDDGWLSRDGAEVLDEGGVGQTPRRLPFKSEELGALAQALLRRDGPGATYTLQELLWAWDGDAHAAQEPARLDTMAQLLAGRRAPFARDPRRPFIHRVHFREEDRLRTQAGKARRRRDNTFHEEQAQIIDLIERLFPPEAGLYRRLFTQDRREVTLAFCFPAIARQRHADAIEALEARSGWLVRLREDPHQGALSEAALEALPESCTLLGGPSLHLSQRRVVVRVEAPGPGPEVQAEIGAAYRARTGFELEFVVKGGSSNAQVVLQRSCDDGERSAEATNDEGQVALKGLEGRSAMEVNATFAVLRGAFEETPHDLLKLSCKGEYIQLGFISPEIGGRYESVLQTLSERVGWPLRVRPHADQHRLKAIASALLPSEVVALSTPSVLDRQRIVRFKVEEAPDPEAVQRMSRAFDLATGWSLEFKLK